MKFCAIFLCLVAGIAGCSSKTTPPDPYATVSGFCEGWGKAACSTTVVLNCSGADAKDVTDVQTNKCIAKQQFFCEGLVPDGYVSTQAEACLAGVQKAYSDGTLSATEINTVRHLGAPCDHLIKGPKGKGETCTVDNDCDTVENYVCVLKAGVGACAIPTVVDNGTSCKAPEATCNPGFYCDKNCIASAAQDEDCAHDYECGTGLVCTIPAGSDTGTCTAPVPQTKCTADQDCISSKVCDIAAGGTMGTCVSRITLTPDTSLCGDLQ
jgi:hypothetical protein